MRELGDKPFQGLTSQARVDVQTDSVLVLEGGQGPDMADKRMGIAEVNGVFLHSYLLVTSGVRKEISNLRCDPIVCLRNVEDWGGRWNGRSSSLRGRNNIDLRNQSRILLLAGL